MFKIEHLAGLFITLVFSATAPAALSEVEKERIKQHLIFQSKYVEPTGRDIDLTDLRREVDGALKRLNNKIKYLDRDRARIRHYIQLWREVRFNPYNQGTRWLKPELRQKIQDDCCRAKKDRAFAESLSATLAARKAQREKLTASVRQERLGKGAGGKQ